MATRQGPPPPSTNIRQDLQATESTANLRRTMLGQLDSIVLKTLRVDPRDRYASSADLATDLQRFLDGEPVAAHQESAASRGFRILRRGRAAIAAGVIFLLLAGAGAWQWQRLQAEKAASATREAEVQGRESQLRALLEQMEHRLDAAKPGEDNRPALVADVGEVKKAFAKDYPAIAARTQGENPLLPRAIRYLDRVQAVAPGAPVLGLEVADAYQELGILQENAAAPTPASRGAALETYRKAAVTLASCPADAQVLERMAMLRERAQKIGGTLEEAATEPAPATAPPPTEEPAVTARAPLSTPRANPPSGSAAVAPPPVQIPAPAPIQQPAAVHTPPPRADGIPAELLEDLNRTESRIQIAEVTLAPIIASLTQQGQTLNADTLNWMSRMKTMLEKGRQEMAGGNPAAAKESFAIARAFADKVLRSVGR